MPSPPLKAMIHHIVRVAGESGMESWIPALSALPGPFSNFWGQYILLGAVHSTTEVEYWQYKQYIMHPLQDIDMKTCANFHTLQS